MDQRVGPALALGGLGGIGLTPPAGGVGGPIPVVGGPPIGAGGPGLPPPQGIMQNVAGMAANRPPGAGGPQQQGGLPPGK